MPKEFFSVANSVALDSLSSGSRIHVIGVCGVAMAQLAMALAERGYRVSGSDKDFYEPMSGLLAKSAVKIIKGYSPDNISPDLDLVVIGNALSYGHPEIEMVEKLGVPYTFFPKALYELLIKNHHSIVVAGTHGKTTTSALFASVLEKIGTNPAYFIGGHALDLPESLHLSHGKFSVVEGDEYDSVFFAKVPKFDFYKPNTAIITSVEYDHADIYPSLAEINAVFSALVKRIPGDGLALCCIDDGSLKDLVSGWRQETACKILTYGLSEGADFRLLTRTFKEGNQTLTVLLPNGGRDTFTLSKAGVHNARNALAVYAAATQLHLEIEKVKSALSVFKGVKRRQEVRLQTDKVAIIEDFAHHPTAIRETVNAIREAYPKHRLWAVFEPRSNTSRKKIFRDEYIEAFKNADRALLCQVALRENETTSDLLDVAELSQLISKGGIPCLALPDSKGIEDYLVQNRKDGDLFLIMSNGSFGGLITNLLKKFKN